MKGYNALATVMSNHPRLRIFRCFGDSTFINLLGFQAELFTLGSDLQNFIVQDQESGVEEPSFQLNFQALIDAAEHGNTNRQWDTILKLRPLLKDYHEALLRAAAIKCFSRPSPADSLALRTFLKSERCRHPGFLEGLEAFIWAEKHESDMVSLAPRPPDRDTLARWIDRWFLPWYHDKIGYRHKDRISVVESGGGDGATQTPGQVERIELPLYDYPDEKVSQFADVASTIMASLWPILGILVLYVVQSPLARIGLIMAFTILFSLTVVLTTAARKVDTFVSTSAFAAVMVVFISGGSMVCPASEGSG